MAAEQKQEMEEGAAVGEKGPATADKAVGKTRMTEEEKGDAAADKEKEEKGAIDGNEEEGEEEEEEERARTEEKGEDQSASAKRGHKKKAEAEEAEGMFRRTKGECPEEKGARAVATEEVAGKKEIIFFKASVVITLETSDGMLFMVSEEAAQLSMLLADMIGQGCAGGIIQLPNVDARAVATGKSVQKTRKIFGITRDFTEEEELLRQESPWAFEE
ncbi:hypothetical protein ZWY2020_005200 [Hordeum vulgare]|nr:hypothetical protein ZWY2020_005200 [Hordeum vulgare]